MGVPEYHYDATTLRERGELFPEEITNDPWIAFHGTSGTSELSIETTGLEWSSDLARKVDVEKVVGIFQEMGWAGCSPGGLAVLKPFSLEYDFDQETKKPVFLAEYSLRAHTYATREFAGGETARAFRYALSDLRRYLESETLRAEHLAGRGRLWGCGDNKPIQVDLDWLQMQLTQLAPLQNRCKFAFENHAYGIVYAVRFGSNDVNDLTYDASMGFKAWTKVDTSRLVAKVVVPADAKTSLEMPDEVRDRFLARLKNKDCLLGSVSSRGCDQQPRVQLG